LDVVTSHNVGLHNYKTAIECKYWKDKVSKDTVMKLKETISDCNIDKAVVVSKNGFTPDAISFAKHIGVSLVELRRPTQADWKGRVREIKITSHAIVPEIYDFYIQVISDNSDDEGQRSTNAQMVDIYEPKKSTVTLSDRINEEIVSSDWKNNDVTDINIIFSNGTVFKDKLFNMETKVEKISFKVKTLKDDNTTIIKGEDHVSMLMFSLFDKKRFVLSPEGKIRESTP
jgi:hypothetical protein